ncbi:unnamed protein product [Anisakis simplex]|uniref:Uncharacterized protein n=1 Tax=Anisakis simplex TaxID=6269 RepID=A0A0M3K0N2_ANISI|nr:unnamed protein product [Anisakis simplex]
MDNEQAELTKLRTKRYRRDALSPIKHNGSVVQILVSMFHAVTVSPVHDIPMIRRRVVTDSVFLTNVLKVALW